ncbi:MAG: hypothetical protein ACI936_003464 [Paraglaciecola sp.]|jgi:hypothetical protein
MVKTRDNHYVPQWYQKGFLLIGKQQLRYLNMQPDTITLPNGQLKPLHDKKWCYTTTCFYKTDLYTTFFGEDVNDEVERILFGEVDDKGANAIRAFIQDDAEKWRINFENFFSFIDSQRIRTIKGLDWIQSNYSELSQVELMVEMQKLQNLNCTLWTEGVREIVSANDSSVKFIITDHPVTIYNHALEPESNECRYPNDPSIALKGSQTIYPLDQNHCLILTNLEYAQDPENENPLENRVNPARIRQTLAKTDSMIKTRNLSEEDVLKINLILKKRAKQFIAAGKEEWLYPENHMKENWADLKDVLLPPKNQISEFTGEIIVGYADGTSHYQDAFGRTEKVSKHLLKNSDESQMKPNVQCGCGSGRKYKKCCRDKPKEQRTSWTALSIRERNLGLYRAIKDIFGLNVKDAEWDDVRRNISGEQISELYRYYGYLWPRSTDIYDLLPKPDEKLRALYSGLLDPRFICKSAIGITPYFDEVLLINPLMYPNGINPKFSPIEHPEQFKLDTLKNVFLLLTIEPLVNKGVINLIPDPTSFDEYLKREMIRTVENRKGNATVSPNDISILEKLNFEVFERVITCLPESAQKRQIRQKMPELTDEKVAELQLNFKEKAEADPLALLQDLDMSKDGQLHFFSLVPNYEMAMFTAQVTGSIIVTDSETRWNELQQAQNRIDGLVELPWINVSNNIYKREFVLNMLPENSFYNYESNGFFDVRNIFRNIQCSINQGNDISEESLIGISKSLDIGIGKILDNSDASNSLHQNTKLKILSPRGGFTDNNVQRMLVSSNSEQHLPSVNTVMFIEPQSKLLIQMPAVSN